ncbi:MAG: hypothetical protein Q7T20_10675 [Saprospiraceae bacterium]|nr:hypothetical protein [Saprospiraceae bacterium]
MKKTSMKHEMMCLMLILFASVLAVSCNDSNAGTTTKTEPATQPTRQNGGEGEGNNMGNGNGMGMNHSNNAERDYVIMHEGKVMMMKGEKSMPMTSDMTMSNGTMVMKNGIMMMKDGTSKRLQEGECVYMDGSMGRMDMKDHKHE